MTPTITQYAPASYLTNAILLALVHKVDYWTRTLDNSESEPVAFYESDNIIWTTNTISDVPTLVIKANDGHQLLKIWLSEPEEGHEQILVNTNKKAEEDIQYFVSFENIVTAEIDCIKYKCIDLYDTKFDI